MRSLLILVAICFSATAFAQSAPPKVGNKSLVQVKPKEPMGCKLVGTVRGTKLWAGDCVGSELRGSTTTTESQALPEQVAIGRAWQRWTTCSAAYEVNRQPLSDEGCSDIHAVSTVSIVCLER